MLLPVARAADRRARATRRARSPSRPGVELELLPRSRRALGLPVPDADARRLGETDLEAAQATAPRIATSASRTRTTLEVTRVLGQGMARYAEATRALVARTFLEPGDSTSYELARRYRDRRRAADAARRPVARARLRPAPAAGAAQRRHSGASARAGRLDDTQRDRGRLRRPRRLHRARRDRSPVEELGGRRRPALASSPSEVVEPPVRVVKLIGDAVMLVSPDAEPMRRASTLELIERAAAEDGLPAAAGGHRLRSGRPPLGRLVRHAGEPREPR